MVDGNLPLLEKERPLRYLFLDLNSYFASVEQQEHPELRGKPVGVGPVTVDTGTIVAASYEAKKFGVKTGTLVGEAKRLCPDIVIQSGNWKAYAAYHKRIIEVAETVLPVEEVCSIDEMRFRLLGEEREPARAVEIAKQIKQALYDHVGECMNCSIGIAPNPFLAKIGTELQKPDGLVVLESKDLPQALYGLKLTDFTGISRRTEIRLNAAGIFTSEDLCNVSLDQLRKGFKSIIGERWWYLLRGFEVPMEKSGQKSLGHSHVLAPDLRNDQGCRDVLLRLLQKASARLRKEGFWAGHMTIFVKGIKKSWDVGIRLPPTQDTVTMNEYFLQEWAKRDFNSPIAVGVTFHDLRKAEQVTPSLFDPTRERSKFNEAIDEVNQKFGKNKVYLAGMEHAKDTADEKIAFQKTWLFSEGKGDQDWELDTFRGLKRKEEDS
jgi:DNA polymerase-4